MNRLRIRCRIPEQTRCMGRVPGTQDVQVHAVADDGTEVELHNVTAVRFEASAGEDPVIAHVTFVNVETDVEAVNELDVLRGQIEALEAQLESLRTERAARVMVGTSDPDVVVMNATQAHAAGLGAYVDDGPPCIVPIAGAKLVTERLADRIDPQPKAYGFDSIAFFEGGRDPAYHAKIVDLVAGRVVHCAVCRGNGVVHDGDVPKRCGTCDGRGTVPREESTT